jgi:hypothetical protein
LTRLRRVIRLGGAPPDALSFEIGDPWRFYTLFWKAHDPKPETPENEFREEFERRVAFADLRFNQDTVNEEFKKAREYRDEIAPKFTDLEVTFKRGLLQATYRVELEKKFGMQAFALWEADVMAFDPAIEDFLRPVFQQHCNGCHQPAKAGGGYVMTAFDRMFKGGESGEPAIVPGAAFERHRHQRRRRDAVPDEPRDRGTVAEVYQQVKAAGGHDEHAGAPGEPRQVPDVGRVDDDERIDVRGPERLGHPGVTPGKRMGHDGTVAPPPVACQLSGD